MVLITHPQPERRGHERVGLYVYSPSGSQWPVIGRTFTFTTLRHHNDKLHCPATYTGRFIEQCYWKISCLQSLEPKQNGFNLGVHFPNDTIPRTFLYILLFSMFWTSYYGHYQVFSLLRERQYIELKGCPLQTMSMNHL